MADDILDRLTRQQLHEIVDVAIGTRDRTYQKWSGSDYLSGHAQEEQDAAIGELSDALDRYGL